MTRFARFAPSVLVLGMTPLGGCIAPIPCPEGELANEEGCVPADAGATVDGCVGPSYRDMDGDGFGDPAVMSPTCPVGYVTSATDCDDSNPARRPDADEICDGLDNDCNERVDEGTTEALCGTPDHASSECVAGACATTCEAGFDDCEATASGCETALGTVTTCTGCGEACGWTCRSSALGCNDPVAIAAGNTTCVTRADGTMACWGANGAGQAGIGALGDVLTPTAISLPAGRILDVASGADHSCVILASSETATSGAVYCWGGNASGQLGNGSTTSSLIPVAVTGLTTAVEIEAGYRFTCARTATGLVSCWGDNAARQLGQDDTTTRRTPVTVSGVSGAVSIDLGEARACAASRATGVVCWGQGHFGRETFTLGAAATDVAAGLTHTCAIGGTSVYCWGDNAEGQLGTGDTTDAVAPVELPALRATDLSAGTLHTCARTEDGNLYCWGNNDSGQLGIGSRTASRSPMLVSLSGVLDIEAGAEHVCATTRGVGDAPTAARMYCWGAGGQGAIGVGDTLLYTTPTSVLAPL